MIIGVLKEHAPETRVSLVPEVVAAFVKLNVTVWVETGAGDTAFYSDSAYTTAGAVLKSGDEIRSSADVVMAIHTSCIGNAKPGAVLMGVFQPLFHTKKMQEWAEKGYTVFSLDTIPRTLFPPVHDRSWQYTARQGTDTGCRCSRPPGHCYRQKAGSSGRGI